MSDRFSRSVMPSKDVRIERLSRGDLGNRQWRMVEDIFFQSTPSRRFPTPQDRQRFFERWTSFYRENEAKRILLAISGDGTVAGYLTGCGDSRAARRLYDDLPHYALFEDQFAAYPAHLHVNCKPDFRNKGIGTSLVMRFSRDCAAEGLAGLHLVTDAAARNVAFYRRCGFDVSIGRRWRDRALLFMGKAL